MSIVKGALHSNSGAFVQPAALEKPRIGVSILSPTETTAPFLRPPARTFTARMVRSRISLLLLTLATRLRKSLSHLSVAFTNPSRRLLCATDRNEGSLMEPILPSLRAVLRGVLILGLSLSVFAQIPAAPDAYGFPSGRNALPRPVFEFRGIRIGDEMKEAERKFLALKVSSLSSKPGLCGSDGIKRIETCTDVLDTGEYVNMTMLDRRVAQIYVSSDRRTKGNSYNSYVLALGTKYGRPDKLEIRYYRNGVETGSSGEHLRWLNGDQYMEGDKIERAITIGSKALDAKIDELESVYERN